MVNAPSVQYSKGLIVGDTSITLWFVVIGTTLDFSSLRPFIPSGKYIRTLTIEQGLFGLDINPEFIDPSESLHKPRSSWLW